MKDYPAMDLTVFLTSVGEPTTSETRRCLSVQTRTDFQYAEILDHRPLYKAFQAMPDRATTAWYIQLDADMLLLPDAIERLYSCAVSAPPEVCLVCGFLWDDIAGRPILGIKCFRVAVAQQVPFRDMLGSDADQVTRMFDLGYRSVLLPETPTGLHDCLGEHAHWDPARTYRHWREATMKQRTTGRHAWIEETIPRLRRRFLETKDPIREAAWYGAIVGSALPLDGFKDNDGSIPEEWSVIRKYMEASDAHSSL